MADPNATETLRRRAEQFLASHRPGNPVVLVNVWDAASARTVASLPGCEAVATASWSIAAAHGVPDDGSIGLEAMLAAVRRIANSVDLPVSADLQDGFDDPWQTVQGALQAGAVGANLEDRAGDPETHAERIAQARAAADAMSVPFVINARTDVLFAGHGDVADAIRRGRLYLDAGADCVFVLGASDADTISRLTETLDRVAVLANPASPPLSALAELGVARVSFGPGPMRVAMAALRDAARQLFNSGPYPPTLAQFPPVG